MATVTFTPPVQEGVIISENLTIESRLAALEHHFHSFLKWQGIESFSAKASDALSRRKPSIKVTEIKEATASIEEVSAESVPEPQVESIPATPTQVPTELAYKIMQVIQGYGQHLQASDAPNSREWAGKSMFVGRVEKQVELDAPIKMILPAFPWKSINRVDKVTGSLPDLGEVLALSRLNSLCDDVKKVYPRGAQVTIATDGLVFDDLVGIPDEDTWAYSEVLMNIAAKKGLKNIKMLRVMDFVGLTDGQEMNKDIYLSMTTKARETLIEKYCRTEAEVREMIATDEDTLLTYRGFIRFLETNLKHNPTAKQITSGSQFRK